MRTASRLRQQLITLARKLKSAEVGAGHLDSLDLIRDGLLLADLTLQLDDHLCGGTPFPAIWLVHVNARIPAKHLARS